MEPCFTKCRSESPTNAVTTRLWRACRRYRGSKRLRDRSTGTTNCGVAGPHFRRRPQRQTCRLGRRPRRRRVRRQTRQPTQSSAVLPTLRWGPWGHTCAIIIIIIITIMLRPGLAVHRPSARPDATPYSVRPWPRGTVDVAFGQEQRPRIW